MSSNFAVGRAAGRHSLSARIRARCLWHYRGRRKCRDRELGPRLSGYRIPILLDTAVRRFGLRTDEERVTARDLAGVVLRDR